MEDDHGGHLIGARFGGASEGVNLVPQNSNLNQGAWKRMEDTWEQALRRKETVFVDIKPLYSPNDRARPAAFQVAYTIDDGQSFRFFENAPGGKQ